MTQVCLISSPQARRRKNATSNRPCSRTFSALLELGVGFAFVGSEYHLVVGEEDYYLDLLFYHIQLRCFVVIELKTGEFKPEYAGKMNFYLTAVDRLVKHVP